VKHLQHTSQRNQAIRPIPGKLNQAARNLAITAFALAVICLFSSTNAAALFCPQPNVKCLSPILVDTDGSGFHLTSAKDGVVFDIEGNGHPLPISWTAAGSTNAFLALPHDGKITNGKELFGDFTPQPASDDPNGFLALAVYDKPENGGNGDGVIDDKDAIFPQLRLWIDRNHDGIAQPDEIYTLHELGVFSISLHYKESWRVDAYGNLFRYKSIINVTDKEADESHDGRTIYDVFFRSLGNIE